MNINNVNGKSIRYFLNLVRRPPQAYAEIKGSAANPAITGTVLFWQTPFGVLMAAEVNGLPMFQTPCRQGVFGFHIHEGGACTGDADDPFADVGMHYNPGDCEHPYHAGDLPPLFENQGYALTAFLTDRFTVEEIVGRTVIIHSAPDDFTTQPSGNSGSKIACGRVSGMRT